MVIMHTTKRALLLAAILVTSSMPALAACNRVNPSPESPTAVLALLGTAGAFAGAARSRLSNLLKKK